MILENGIVIYDEHERSIIASCTSGLCNRLFNLAGCARIAPILQRSLLAYWPVNAQVACPITVLFKKPPRTLTSNEFELRMARPEWTTRIYNSGIGTQNDKQECLNIHDDDQHQVILVKSWCYPYILNQPPEPCVFRDIVYSWEFSDPILEQALRLPTTENMVGVHIRLGDEQPSGVIKHADFFSKSKIEYFAAMMRLLLDRDPSYTFFVATNHKSVVDHLTDIFGSTCSFWLTKNKTRGFYGIIDAAAELVHLSRTRFILGTDNSQYSWMAGVLGNRPTMTVVGDQLSDETYKLLLETDRHVRL